MPSRPLAAPLALLVALLAVVGVEVGVRAAYHTRDGLVDKAAQFAATARADTKNLVILGTCLPEQHIHADVLEAGLGGGWTVHNLGNQATSPLDWDLLFRNAIPHDRVQGVLLAYGTTDLAAPGFYPWESRVLDLASWRDLPNLAANACTTVDCAADLGLRMVSLTWRYRPRLANRVWGALGVLTTQAPPPPPPPHGKEAEAPLLYLARLLADAQAAGVPVWTLALPHRPPPAGTHPPAPDAAVRRASAILDAGGARPIATPALPASAFLDETHLTPEASRAFSHALAAPLRAALDGGTAGAGAGTPAPTR